MSNPFYDLTRNSSFIIASSVYNSILRSHMQYLKSDTGYYKNVFKLKAITSAMYGYRITIAQLAKTFVL
jgi:hypothetical protein